MKILNERESFLSNFEVSEHLKGLKKRYNWTFSPEEEEKGKKFKKRFTECGLNLEVITRDALQYLNNSPAAIENKQGFIDLMTFLNNFDLMKVEKLQIVNSLPRSMVILYSLVEECDQRFSEDQCQQILDKIQELFPVEEEEEEEEEEEAQDEEIEGSA